MTTRCGHEFCQSCIIAWVEAEGVTCPLCRKKLYIRAPSPEPDGTPDTTPLALLPPDASERVLFIVFFVLPALILASSMYAVLLSSEPTR